MRDHKQLRIATALVGTAPVLVILVSALAGGMDSEEPPPALFVAMGLAFAAAVLAGVTATKMSRRWWPWSIGAMFLYGLPAVVLALLRSGMVVADDPAEVARRPLPEPAPWFIGGGVLFGLEVILLLQVDASGSDPVTTETVTTAVSMLVGFPMLLLLLVGASKRGGKKRILAARELVGGR